MNIKTSSAIKGGYYGRWVYDKKVKAASFERLGRAVYVENALRCIEDGEVRLGLAFSYMGTRVYKIVSRKAIADNTVIQILANEGADVTKKNFDIFVDSLRIQEEEMTARVLICISLLCWR